MILRESIHQKEKLLHVLKNYKKNSQKILSTSFIWTKLKENISADFLQEILQ